MIRQRHNIVRGPRRALREAPWIAALGAIGGAAACSGPLATGYPIGTENARPIVQSDAERDLDCPPADIRIEEKWGGVWEAVGCGKKARYKANCDSIRCEVHGEDEPPVPFRDRPDPSEVPR